jgi:hypothetical protein
MADIARRLDDAEARGDLLAEARRLADELAASGAGLESVEPILGFMEAHPLADLGTPGALVHHVERFFGQGYEALLLASIARRPTAHTAWMLHRVMNGTRDPKRRREYLALLQGAGRHPAADEAVRDCLKLLLDDG